ncbi:peptidase domain-containing ABC transporter [Rikenella microfusus]|uniref:peptidase domain-containing ABC transporter n=1 Tax=Rikenella microfusus TaxID=28139 RepID=UPI00235614B2|nr:peptidase domain-containing ABC transporter [Rikenella microfusus]
MPSYYHYQQLDAMDCGATCLRQVAKFYGRTFSSSFFRERCHMGREGVSMLGISDAAESVGFRSIGVKLSVEQLCHEVPLPCILHWNQNHFVVLYEAKRRGNRYTFLIADPAVPELLKYDQSRFSQCWLSAVDDQQRKFGTALLLEPTPRFYNAPDGSGTANDKIHFGYIIGYLRPYKRYLVQLFLGLLTGSVISFIFPFLTQSVVDNGIGNSNINIVVAILVAQIMLTAGQTANDFIRSWLMLHVATRLSISLISDFLAKLMRLPIAFFDSKMVGDIMQRIDDHRRIQNFLTGTLISLIVAGVTFIIYSIVMGTYDWVILGIFLAGSMLYMGWVLLFLKRRRKIDYMRFQESAANQSSIVQLVSGMQDIKLNHCEKQQRWAWENIQARLYKISMRGLTLAQTQQIGGLFIDQTKNVLVSFIAAEAVIAGNMTLGMMMAMQYIIGQLNGTISQFIGFVQESQDAKISLERLNEIHSKTDEEPEETHKIQEIPVAQDLVFKHVTFRYGGPNAEKVLNDLSLTIQANKVTAIVGASGSGKTTLLKLLLGFYTPAEGQVLLGTIPLEHYSDSAWRSRCGVVMQEGFIFSDSIAANISLSDENPDMERIKSAIATANIGEFIESLPLRYHTRIGADGHGLSTGQKQRILIARAAYKGAPYLMLDEATNSLDANNERVIMENLNTLFRNRTVVIVAHRLSTVKNADKIVVLNQGRLVEEGTHNELINRRGYYYNLIKDQLELGN